MTYCTDWVYHSLALKSCSWACDVCEYLKRHIIALALSKGLLRRQVRHGGSGMACVECFDGRQSVWTVLGSALSQHSADTHSAQSVKIPKTYTHTYT